MKDFKFQRFLPITKVDEDERMVYGYASTPDLDSDGEVIKVEAMEKALPNYLKFPTIREMHQPKAIGTTKNAEIDKNGMYIGAKIVADDAWKLVKEGVYKAFSIGGNVVKRVGNVIQELDLVEISLVDVPANKSAVIEVWKSEGMSKNAETVYSLTNLMIQVKDTIMYYDYLGKNTKKLSKVLEMLKELISIEAQEPEADKVAMSRTIETLKGMDFADNKFANIIREGVISAMKKQLKKEDEVEEVATPEVVEEAEPKVETEGESPTDTEEEVVEETEAEEVEETEDADEKITMANQTLEKLDTVETQKKLNLAKTVTNIASTVEKMASYMEKSMKKIDERLTALENTPAATKSKSVMVLKNNAEAVEEVEKTSSDVEAKKARLVELTKIFNDIGANAFAKQGYSKEAGRLKAELEQLS
jgi:HK97 family phage prohead protease